MTVLSRFSSFTHRHPIIRGMLSYAIIWPTSCIIQQTIAGKTWENYDWKQAMRFCLYGGLFTAPTLYGWVRLSSFIWPQASLRTAITKVLCVLNVFSWNNYYTGDIFRQLSNKWLMDLLLWSVSFTVWVYLMVNLMMTLKKKWRQSFCQLGRFEIIFY